MYGKLIIAGRLGGDPETVNTSTGTIVTKFSVAVNRKDETTWFRITTFDRLAEICSQYLSRGRAVLVEGRLESDPATGGPRIWHGQDGTPRASFDVIADNVTFMGGSDTQ